MSRAALVIAPQWLGDAVMSEPLMRRLHAQGHQLTVAALAHIGPVYRAMPSVANVIELPFTHGQLDFSVRRGLAQQLRGQFEAAYVLPNSLKSALLPWLAKIPKRVGYTGEARLGLLTQRLKNPSKDARPMMVPFYSALSGDNDVARDKPHLVVAAHQSMFFCVTHSLRAHQYVVLAPGSEFGAAKRWPVSHYAWLARQIAGMPPLDGTESSALEFDFTASEMGSLPATMPRVVLLGSAKEADLCAQVARGTPGVLNLAGKTNIAEAMACIANASHLVSNDSGLMHIGAALGVPQVAIFGSSSPEHTPPLSPVATVMWLKNDPNYRPALDCAPCYSRTCRFGHTRCMTDVRPDHVLAALR